MENKLKGLVVFAKDYKENDKQIILFTVEKGKIFAIIKGVKKNSAKLKYAKELFCFGEYILHNRNNFYVVTGCEPIEMFSSLSQDPEKYIEAQYIVGVMQNIIPYNVPNVSLFLETINALKTLNYTDVAHNIVACKFLISLLQGAGYKLSLNKCAICGSDFFGKKYFIIETGEIVCQNCKMMRTIEIDNLLFANLNILAKTDYDKLSSINLKDITNCINFLNKNINTRFDLKMQLY